MDDGTERQVTYVPKASYPNPPIDEAILQFTFIEPLRWNVTTPGQIYEAIKSEYGADPETQEQLSATFEPDPATGTGASFALNRGDVRFIYRSDDRQRLVIANPNFVAVGSNRPYDGWLKLRERMEWVWGALARLSQSPPIQTVSIRYINRIVIPETNFNTDTYFSIPIRTAGMGSWAFSSFVHRVESTGDSGTRARSTFASMPTEPEKRSQFLLDLEFLYSGDPLAKDDALKQANNLKNLENAEFEGCITDETRKLFR